MKPINMKTSKISYILIGGLLLLILLINVFVWSQSDFLEKLKPVELYEEQNMELREHVLLLEFDRIRIEDASNILLSLQDFYYENGAFPDLLEELKEKKYIRASIRLVDPETSQPYFYHNRGDDFVFCVWLSDTVKGVNTGECSSDPSENELLQQQRDQEEPRPPRMEESRVEIIGDAPVNVREEPNADSKILSRAQPGDVFVRIEQRGSWYHIVIDGDLKGWVHGDYAQVVVGE